MQRFERFLIFRICSGEYQRCIIRNRVTAEFIHRDPVFLLCGIHGPCVLVEIRFFQPEALFQLQVVCVTG